MLCFREKKQQQPKSIIYFITHSNGYETLLTLGYFSYSPGTLIPFIYSLNFPLCTTLSHLYTSVFH